MNDQMMNEGFWSVQNKVWLQMAMWMEWFRPFLYCLLAMALLSVLWTFVNLVLLCRKELSGKQAQKKIKVRTKAEPARGARNVARATLKKRSQYAVKTLFLLGYCCAFSQGMVQAQSPSLNTDIRDGNQQQIKTLLAKGANVNAVSKAEKSPLTDGAQAAECKGGCFRFKKQFESGFPYGKDQWISAAATSWAVMALALTIDLPDNAGTSITW